MAVSTPTINKIIKMTEFDLLRTSITAGNMYMCLDSQKLYYDETNSRRVVYFYQGVKTYNDLIHNITPVSNTTYYCWEDNSLWLWMNKWITIYSDKTYPSAYVYDNQSVITPVYRYDEPLMPADDNGLLHDGSVVIRDRQRIIKGKIFVDDGNDNLIISSFLGGGVRILPNGQTNTEGEFFIGDDGTSLLRSEFHHTNNETYVDYSEIPDQDPSPFPNQSHIYKIFHEGNIDTSLIREITAQEIYNKLVNATDLPSPFAFNVSQLNGKSDTAFAPTVHTHTSSAITDFASASQSQAFIKIKEIFNNMTGEGITASFDTSSEELILSANNFVLTLSGDVSGTATVRHLTSTTMNVTVDPSKHVHQNYIDRMNDLQQQINDITVIDPDDYYTKIETDILIEGVSGTAVPTANKPLLVNSDLILPATAANALKLTNSRTITFTGDITGQTTTDLSADVNIALSASNIISASPVTGKAVIVNSAGNLPVNATSASQLNHSITMSLSGEASGSAVFDTSLTAFDLSVTLVPGSNILQDTDIGVRVPHLTNGKVPASELPDVIPAIYPRGMFNPQSGYPTETPTEGYFWTANAEGTINGVLFEVGDWCLYLNTQWNKISTNDNVLSVNGYRGVVQLNYADVGAISTSYLDYTLGNPIPANKIVLTSSAGQIEGASVTNLTNPFSILTDSLGDIVIDPSSVSTSTDGTTDLNLKLMISATGYQDIIANAGHTIQYLSSSLPHKAKLNFKGGLKADLSSDDNNTIDITLASGLGDAAIVYWDPLNDTQFKETLMNLYQTRTTTPILILTYYNNMYYSFLIDKSYPNAVAGTSVQIEPSRYNFTSTLTNFQPTLNKTIDRFKITFAEEDSQLIVSRVEIATATSSVLPPYLATTADNTATPFIPLMDAQPTSKKYVDDAIEASRGKSYCANIGDNSATSFVLTHNFNTRDIVVQIYDNTTYQDIIADVYRTTVNTITVQFAEAPTLNQYRVVIK